MAELADAPDLKSVDRKVMWVRPPPRALAEFRPGRLQSEAVSENEGRAGETQIAGRSRGCVWEGGRELGCAGEWVIPA